jgi:hypothetical protein
MDLDNMSREALESMLAQLEGEYAAHRASGLDLDLTRGKPSTAQLDLSGELDGALAGDYLASDGTDTRGYGGLDGLPEAKAVGAELLAAWTACRRPRPWAQSCWEWTRHRSSWAATAA